MAGQLWVATLTKVVIFAGTFYFLYEALLTENAQPETWLLAFNAILSKGERFYILLAAVLIFCNWGLEARKWQNLAAKVENINFWQAYQAVLVGVCLGFITPNRLGDYAGRIMGLQSRQRLESIGAIFLGRFCQLIITVIAGTVGILFFLIKYYHLDLPVFLSLGFGLLSVIGVLLLLLFRPRILIGGLSVLPSLHKFIRYVNIITRYTLKEIINLLQLSFLRYLVFAGQYMLLLMAFGVEVSWWEMALGISGTFLLKSVVPSLSSLSDLGMRELSAIYFFSLLGQNKLVVMSASLSLWFLNIALPSLVGLIFVYRMKWQRTKKQKRKWVNKNIYG